MQTSLAHQGAQRGGGLLGIDLAAGLTGQHDLVETPFAAGNQGIAALIEAI